MLAQACSTCGTTPTLYIANGRQFCKAHKAEADVCARAGVRNGYLAGSGYFRDAGKTLRQHLHDHDHVYKRDRPIGIIRAK